MTTFTGPLYVKKPNEETVTGTVDVSGTATFTKVETTDLVVTTIGTAAISLNGVTIVNADTTVVATGTAAPIPASAQGFVTVNIGGTDYLMAYFTKA